jgi:hypothetical protein
LRDFPTGTTQPGAARFCHTFQLLLVVEPSSCDLCIVAHRRASSRKIFVSSLCPDFHKQKSNRIGFFTKQNYCFAMAPQSLSPILRDGFARRSLA